MSQEMSENGSGGQLMVKARFNFKQNNEDELSFSKGEMILVTRQEEGGWWEGTLNGKTGWFPSNYVREVKPCGELGRMTLIVNSLFYRRYQIQKGFSTNIFVSYRKYAARLMICI